MKTLYDTIGKRMLVSAAFVSLALLLLSALFYPLRGQNPFAPGVEDPFGIDLTPLPANLVFHALADMDADGDLDVFVSTRHYVAPCWVVSAFEYYENQGSSECPEYELVPGETFGLPVLSAVTTFVDIDADGDLDAFISNHCYTSTVTYHRNTGTATDPQFSSIPTQTLNTNWGVGFAMFAFGDLDGDGDYDALLNGLRPALFKYVENVGTPANFAFAAPVDNPFGLSIPSFNSSEWSQMVDWDCDGDLDILNGHWQLGGAHENWLLYIHENNGTATAPSFLPPVSTGQLIMPIAMGDMDGDGDMDIVSDEYFYKNITATTCVTLPTAGFDTEKNGLTVEFINTSSGQATDCRPIDYHWNFGDDATDDTPSPSHTYAAAGTYNVCLTVEDVAGQTILCEDVIVIASAVQQQNAGTGLLLSPNPVRDYLVVQATAPVPARNLRIEVINALGMIVRHSEYSAAEWTSGIRVETSDLENGIYTVKVIADRQFWTAQFVKLGQ